MDVESSSTKKYPGQWNYFMKETLECCEPFETFRKWSVTKTECILVPFYPFLFSLRKTFLMILSQHGFSIGNPVQDLRRTSEGSRELFVQIYRFSFAGLLRNISTESLVVYHIQLYADAETSKTERTTFSGRFCKNRRSVACVMRVFYVVVSLNHLSRREVGHHLPPHVINLW